MRPANTSSRSSASSLRRLAVVATVLVTVLAGWLVPATSAEAKAPAATRLSPASVGASGGTRVTITGKNLSKVKAVYVDATKVTSVTHVSKARIRFTAPHHPVGTARIRLVVGKLAYPTSLQLVYVDDTPGATAFEADVFRLTNKARGTARTCGAKKMAKVPAVTRNTVLATAAKEHSADMAAHTFSHDSSDGTTFDARITRAGYTWRSVGENIAAGYPTAATVVAGWLKSPGHCVNVMSASFTELGVGMVTGGSYGTYWTQDFGRPAS
jgi:uncharacterized protein YkwD